MGFLAIMLVVILTRHWKAGNRKLLSAMRNFIICTAMIDAIYFCIDYHVLKTGRHVTLPVFRVLDICTFIGQVYYWAAYIRQKALRNSPAHAKLRRDSKIICILCLALAMAIYGFFMNDYYFVQPGSRRTVSILAQFSICILLTSITLAHLSNALKEVIVKQSRISITSISLLITINGIWNAILVTGLMCGALNAEEAPFFDPTALLIFTANLFTVHLVYREDFTALFHAEGMDAPPETPQSRKKFRLDFLAEAHSLTQREREVMELAYEGLTNPEIADELFISKYTVKRHMHNIFEKLDISTRMELSHLVHQENGPLK